MNFSDRVVNDGEIISINKLNFTGYFSVLIISTVNHKDSYGQISKSLYIDRKVTVIWKKQRLSNKFRLKAS